MDYHHKLSSARRHRKISCPIARLKQRMLLYKQMIEIAKRETQVTPTMATWRQGWLSNREVSKNQQQPG